MCVEELLIGETDFISIRRAYQTTGRDAALAEVRRKFPFLAKQVACACQVAGGDAAGSPE